MKTFSLSWFLNPVKTTLLTCLHQTFPPVVPDTDTYCSMLLFNTSTSLITFSVNQTVCPSVLVKPSSGYIIPGGHQIFFLSTHPVNTDLQRHVLPLELNSYPAYTKVRREKWKMVSKVVFPCCLPFSQWLALWCLLRLLIVWIFLFGNRNERIFSTFSMESTLQKEGLYGAKHPVPLVSCISISWNTLYYVKGPTWQHNLKCFPFLLINIQFVLASLLERATYF